MEDPVFMSKALERVRNIHLLSARYNQLKRKDHNVQLLEMVKEHAVEVAELCQKNDPHYLTEAGDLAILCFELILEGNGSVDETLTRCFKRFEKKLTGLINGKIF